MWKTWCRGDNVIGERERFITFCIVVQTVHRINVNGGEISNAEETSEIEGVRIHAGDEEMLHAEDTREREEGVGGGAKTTQRRGMRVRVHLSIDWSFCHIYREGEKTF